MTLNGFIKLRTAAIILLLLFIGQPIICQKSILDSIYSFQEGTVKTGSALDFLSKKTGYKFTYDSRLINPDKKVVMDFSRTSLGTIISSIIQNDSLNLSVIDNYIIISKKQEKSLKKTDGGNQVQLTGRIIDEESGESLPFATIGLKNRGKGTISNNNGDFILNLQPQLLSDTLAISYIGYQGREIPVEDAAGSNLTVAMRREFISIPEIIIRNQIPQEIIRKALRAIPDNYGTTPVYMTGFYREGVLRKSELQNYSEAVLQIYKSSYTANLVSDQIKVYKSRKIENLDRSDTLAIRLKAGLSTCLELDGIKNLFDFISPSSLKDYNYRLTDIVRYDDESAYAIEFVQNDFSEMPLFRGTVYINTSDMGIYKAEFEINPKMMEKVKESFITGPSHGFNTWPVSVKYIVTYRKVNERYFLNHVRGDLQFTSRQKRRLFNTQFHVFFELAITDTHLENVKRFDKEDLAPIHSIFSKTITNYDPEFWGDQDFLRPETNLLQELKNMKVKLQEFEEK
ncbi:MAG TPA: carboxypeptidase-like regulatory domain-containing protein [Bacteroidales bacterium]|nr:carboxypeptidase-like regulatory domain-containing protein [Bacteroidales bacterium]